MSFQDDLRDQLAALPSDQFVSRFILERIPHLFSDDWASYRVWRHRAAEMLDVDPANVQFVGSSSVGLSLNPTKNFRVFDEKSDIDLAVISTHHFDLAWRVLRRIHLADVSDPRERAALVEHQKRLVYWGCIATDKILRLMPFAGDWGRASISLSSLEPAQGREVNFRIYRDFESLRFYHMNNVEKLKVEQ